MIVYSLRSDAEAIEAGQNAVLTTEKFGFVSTHGLFGSEEWWENIDNGTVRLKTLRGIITSVVDDERGADWRGFTLTPDNGAATEWTCSVNDPAKLALYRFGNRVEIDYVMQERRSPFINGGRAVKCVIEIRIDA